MGGWRTLRGLMITGAALLAGTASAQPVALDTLLDTLPDSPALSASRFEQELRALEREQARDATGWRLFGGADAGYYRELELAGRADYTGYGAQLGLRYPLLGALQQRRATLAESELAYRQSYQATALRQAEQRLALRLTYIDWWQQHQLAAWCRDTAPTASEELALAHTRANNRDLRQSEVRWLDYRWQQLRTSCPQAELHRDQLRGRLARLSDYPLGHNAEPVTVPLPRNPSPADQWLSLIERHPAVVSQQLASEHYARQPDDTAWHRQVEASFTLAQRLDWRSDLPGTGSGLAAGVTFEVPLAALSRDGRSSTNQLRYRAASEQARDVRWQLLTELERSLIRYEQQLQQLDVRQAALDLSRQLLDERAQRQALDGEAGFMNLRSARAELAEHQRDLIGAWHGAWQALAELQLLADAEIPANGTSSLHWQANGADHHPGNEPDWQMAVYLWQSEPLLNPDSRADTLEQIISAGFNHIHLGLNSDQVANTDRLARQLEALVAGLAGHQITLDLLLGEPSWITDEHRADLVALIEHLAHLPFRHLHLDLEVEQLGWPVPRERLQGWLSTLAAVKEASPWPVTLVSHHRWFAPEQKAAAVCIPCRLPELGIGSATLMLYSTAEASVVERMTAILDAWPELDLSLAQSTEANLPRQNSWHGASAEDLAQLGQRLRTRLAPAGLAGLAWQDWADYPKPNP